MVTTTIQLKDNSSPVINQPNARIGLALMRLTIGTMFVWVFFEIWARGYTRPQVMRISSTITLKTVAPQRCGRALWPWPQPMRLWQHRSRPY